MHRYRRQSEQRSEKWPLSNAMKATHLPAIPSSRVKRMEAGVHNRTVQLKVSEK